VTTQLTIPGEYWNFGPMFASGAGACSHIMFSHPAKDLVIRQVHINVTQVATPGPTNWIQLYEDPCVSKALISINPSSVGLVTVPFDPGYGVVAGTALSAKTSTGVSAEFYVEGYTVPAGTVIPN
jgi:hypothetical protein